VLLSYRDSQVVGTEITSIVGSKTDFNCYRLNFQYRGCDFAWIGEKPWRNIWIDQVLVQLVRLNDA